MVSVSVSFLLGICLLYQLPALPAAAWALLMALCGLLCARRGGRAAAVFALGFCWAWWQASAQLDRLLPSDWEGRDFWVEGVIGELPEPQTRATRFVFETRRVQQEGRWLEDHRRLRLYWYPRKGQLPPTLQAGQHWRLQVRLKRPHGSVNPAGFDYEAWLFRHGIHATGYVRTPRQARLLDDPSSLSINRLRGWVDARLASALDAPWAPADEHLAGLLRALAVGERVGLSTAAWDVLRDTGTAHLMAISGLHIGLAAGFGLLAFRTGFRLAGGGSRHLPGPLLAAAGSFLFATAYAALAGFSVPTQRALSMLAVVVGATLLRRGIQPLQGLALALWPVLLIDSRAVLDVGFWLSFAAVAAILLALQGSAGGRGERRIAQGWGRLQWVVSIALVPLTLVQFQQIAWMGPLTNLLAIPWIGCTVVPPLLLGVLLLPVNEFAAALCWQLSAWMLLPLWSFLEWSAHLPLARWMLPAAPAWTWLPALGAVLLLIAPRGMPLRWLGLVWLLPLFWFAPPRPGAGEAWLTLADVGQGLAVIVRTRNHWLVYDTGPAFGASLDAGSAVLVPLLRRGGARAIDTLVVSHGDGDHIGGAKSVLAAMPAQRILTSATAAFPEHAAAPCRRGQSWQWDGVQFAMLHPRTPGDWQGNDASCVLHIRAGGGTRVLLSGDIERAAEAELVREVADQLQADLLIAPHHGSKTSSTPAFLDAVRPHTVAFATGYRNRYRQPAATVLSRYEERGIAGWNTAIHGALTFRLSAMEKDLQVRSQRQHDARIWRHSQPSW